MVLARWQATIVDDAGNIQPTASVEVRSEVAGSPLAVLCSDRNGSTHIGNPFYADSDGFAAFHVTGGVYKITATKGAFSRVWRYVGIGTASEYDIATSTPVVQQVGAGYGLMFESETTVPPSAGAIRFNNAALGSATAAYVSVVNLAGSEIADRLLELYSALRGVKDTFTIANPETGEQASFQIDGAVTDGSPATYITLSISAHNGATSFAGGSRVNFQPNRAGSSGSNAGLTYVFDSGTAGDPGSGKFLFNNAALSSATALHISDTDGNGSDVSAFIASWDDSTTTALRGTIVIRDHTNDSAYAIFNVTGASSDHTSYSALSVTHVTSAGTLSENCSIEFYRTGNMGEVPSARTLTAGNGLTGGGDLSDNRSFAVGAGTGIVANADDVAVDKASDANVRASTSNKVLTADLVETASAGVALSDAATVAVDWDTGINFTLTVTANRAIGNPTNGQPGTWRTILVQGNDATDRTITFGNQYLGEVPTVTDCDSDRWYLLTIYCVSSSHFVVSKKKAKGT